MASATSLSAVNGRANRPGTSKGIVILKLSPGLLNRFAPPNAKEKPTKKNGVNASPRVKEKEPSSPASSLAEPPLPPSSADNASDAASTPAAGISAADAPRRNGVPAPKSGSKRAAGQGADSFSKPKSRPRKKARVDDGPSDHVKVASSHRLGPKANTGAINAGLRALDRSGTPCRRWERKPLQLKSFTGIFWQLPSWRAPRPQKTEENGAIKEGALETGDSDSKANQSASNAPSEKSNSADGGLTPVPPNITGASSPAIAMTA